MRILVVESDTRAALCLTRDLERSGHDVDIAENGSGALQMCNRVALVFLELELSDIDGIDVCRGIRERCDVPVIVLTSRDSEVDRVLGLQAGSDDYVVKPYSFRELRARVDAVMRRVRGTRPSEKVITHGSLRIDPSAHEVLVHERPVQVTRKEFRLLYLLASEPQVVVPRQRIMSEVWDDCWTPSNSRTIDTHVGTLRNKLGAREWIVTVRGVGFKMGCCHHGRSDAERSPAAAAG